MPLYEYQCDACGSVFEVRQKFSDEPLSVHESCGGVVHRLLSVPALQFKGSGWYITDYGRSSGGGSGNGESKGSGESNKGSGESSSKSENKDTKKSDSSSSSSTTTSSSTDKKS